jgi:hypothetical protein
MVSSIEGIEMLIKTFTAMVYKQLKQNRFTVRALKVRAVIVLCLLRTKTWLNSMVLMLHTSFYAAFACLSGVIHRPLRVSHRINLYFILSIWFSRSVRLEHTFLFPITIRSINRLL